VAQIFDENVLYIVSTPIGNLDDMTFRAVAVLKEATLILCEDTRHSRPLLKHFGVETKSRSYHDYNKEKVSEQYVKHIQEVGSIALISDAGTPAVADPGFFLTREAIRAGVKVVPIPGASAVLTGLVASGMPTDRFRFENFAAKKSSGRLRQFEELKTADSTVAMYLSPHHLLKVLDELNEVYGDIQIVLARELTKKYEEFLRGTPAELLIHYEERSPKGEYVLYYDPRNKSGLDLNTDSNSHFETIMFPPTKVLDEVDIKTEDETKDSTHEKKSKFDPSKPKPQSKYARKKES
tara:strand:+ start:6110 stop:6991 length:882 start_codon:yes stop_codon:yes gene_type:complete